MGNTSGIEYEYEIVEEALADGKTQEEITGFLASLVLPWFWPLPTVPSLFF